MPPKARNCQEDFFPPLLSDIAAKIRVMKGGRDRNDDDDIDKKSWPIEVENSGELLKPLKGTFLSVRPSVQRSRTEVSPGQKSSRCGGNGGIICSYYWLAVVDAL